MTAIESWRLVARNPQVPDKRWRLAAAAVVDRRRVDKSPWCMASRCHSSLSLQNISMKSTTDIGLSDVQAVYSGPEGDLWELVMGQQIHIGGFRSSMDLAEKAGIGPGMAGVDLCCCTGAGMRFLVRFRNVARMHGVDATETVVELGRGRCRGRRAGRPDRASRWPTPATRACPTASADFVWGEDAWCYVVDKRAGRRGRPAGQARRHDRLHRLGRGPAGLERRRGRAVPDVHEVSQHPRSGRLRRAAGRATAARCWRPKTPAGSPRTSTCISNMLNMQLTYDALRIIGFDTA